MRATPASQPRAARSSRSSTMTPSRAPRGSSGSSRASRIRSVMGVGGRVNAAWDGHRPRMFPSEFEWVVGCSYRGLPERAGARPQHDRREHGVPARGLRAVGGFRSDVGRVGARPLGCEETELCIRARSWRPDATILYEPSAQVSHRVTHDARDLALLRLALHRRGAVEGRRRRQRRRERRARLRARLRAARPCRPASPAAWRTRRCAAMPPASAAPARSSPASD